MSLTSVSSSQPLSVSETVGICTQAAVLQENLQTSPLRLLVPTEKPAEYKVTAYEPGKPYIAISYVWPSPSWQRLFTSNQPSTILSAEATVKSMHVSQFVSNVVKLMLSRPEGPDFGIWIDHECIKQGDEVEKNKQIAVMDQIYHHARYAAILLEDVALSAEEFTFVTSMVAWRDHRQRYVAIVRRLLSARWFSRAWCSQEMILSRSSEIFIHQAEKPNEPLQINYWTLAGWVNRAAMLDPMIKKLAEPRGIVKFDCKLTWHTSAWAWGILHGMNCFNNFDKIALVLNMLRAPSRLTDLPSRNGSDLSVDDENICKIINVFAILRKDLSLLLAGHSVSARLKKSSDFSWAAYPIPSDLTAETWHPNRYVDATNKAKLPHLREKYLVLEGFADKVVSQESWCIFEENSELYARIGESTHHITARWPGRSEDENWAAGNDFERNHSFQWLRNILLAILQLDRKDLFCNFTAPDDIPRSIFSSMDVFDLEDLEEGFRRHFSRATLFHRAMATQINSIENGGKVEFVHLGLLKGGSITAFGNVSDLMDKTIMQPYGMRPRTFDSNIFTVNALVFDDLPTSNTSHNEPRICCGGLRCFQMIPEENGEMSVRVK